MRVYLHKKDCESSPFLLLKPKSKDYFKEKELLLSLSSPKTKARHYMTKFYEYFSKFS